MIAIGYVPFTFEYVWTFLLMFIASIIAVCIENKNLETKLTPALFLNLGLFSILGNKVFSKKEKIFII